MDLYLLRHAIAVERGTLGYEIDSKRPLTPEGEQKMERIAKGMLALDLSFDLILYSPYTRAKQTADIVAKLFKAQNKLKVSESLAPDGDPKKLIDELKSYGSPEIILLVGHEPCMSDLASLLLTGRLGLSMVMKKGGLCKLTVDSLQYGRCATLEWLLTPRQLALIS
jgi:phosphohistidine phosphatase